MVPARTGKERKGSRRNAFIHFDKGEKKGEPRNPPISKLEGEKKKTVFSLVTGRGGKGEGRDCGEPIEPLKGGGEREENS